MLRCDLSRLLRQTDRFSRQIMMSHGTCLELLDIAAREQGMRALDFLVSGGPLGPSTLDHRPVARIRPVADAAAPKDPMFAHILQRRTNRSRYDVERPAPSDAWRAMQESRCKIRCASVSSARISRPR